MFEETIHGLFEQPITLRGSVYLEHEPLEREPVLTVPPDPVMPTASATTSPDVGAVFPGWTQAGCWNDAAAASACPFDTVLCAGAIDWRFYAPLELRLSGGILSPRTESIGTIADLCALDMLRSANQVDVPACALLPPLACALRQIDITDKTSPAAAEAFSRLYAHTLNPALLVAQDNIVEGLRESFLEGPARRAHAARIRPRRAHSTGNLGAASESSRLSEPHGGARPRAFDRPSRTPYSASDARTPILRPVYD